MKIILVGDGKVGFALSEYLSQENHDITVVDNNSEVLRKSVESLDIFTVKGNGASFEVLKEAGVSTADLLIAATSSDEVNMLSCLFAKRLGTRHTIARIRNPDYFGQMEAMKEEMGLSLIVNPEQATASEIARLVSFPFAASVGSFAEGKVLITDYKIDESSKLVGLSLAEVMQHYHSDILLCAVTRDGKVHIPKGNFVLEEGDFISITGTHASINDFLHKCGHSDKKNKSVILVGGGLIAFYLSKILLESGYAVKIIEKNPVQCDVLCEQLPQALVIEGDGTDQDLLDSERIENAGAFVALSDMDEENLLMSLYAVHKGVKKVVAKINLTGYSDVIIKAGINSVISPKNVTANQIVKFVRNSSNQEGSQINSLYMIGNQAELMEFVATNTTKNLDIPLSHLKLRDNILIAALVRGNKIIIPKGKNRIQEADRVIISTTIKQLEDLNEIFIK